MLFDLSAHWPSTLAHCARTCPRNKRNKSPQFVIVRRFNSYVSFAFSAPSGMPACIASCMSAMQLSGVCSLGLSTTVHPAASAGAVLRVIIANGKFQGVMAPTTPTGCFSVSICRSGAVGCSTWPYALHE